MSRIDDLFVEGEALIGNINKDNIHRITEWISKSQMYMETTYKSLEFTKDFIENARSFNQIMFSYEIYDENAFQRLVYNIKGVREHEKEKARANQQTLEFFKDLNK